MEKILEIIKKDGPLTYQQLAERSDVDEFVGDDVNALLTEGLLVEENGQLSTPEQLKVMPATVVSMKNHFAFARIDGEEVDVHLEAHHLHTALLGDRVFVELKQGVYQVHSVFKRAHTQVVGEIYHLGGKPFIQVNSLASSATSFKLEGYEGADEELVIAKIEAYSEKVIRTKFIKSLGAKNAPGNDIERILIEEEAPSEFPPEVDMEVSKLPFEVSEKDLKGRRDFRADLIVTIDGEDARDFDDAVSVSRTINGYRVGVHIADVSYYVRENTAIDEEAYERGTSIYVLDRVIPMLPFPLSNGICSLRPAEDRLSLSVIMDIDNYGQVLNSEIMPSVINSKARLTYTYVQEVIERFQPENEIEEMLLLLDEVANKIRKQRTRRGSIDLDRGELVIETDKDGKAINVKMKKSIESEQLIEDLMVLTNEVVAEKITELKLPMLYRIHEQPEGERIDNLNYLLKRLNRRPELNPRKVVPKDLQVLVNKYKDELDGPVIIEATLRSLAKARYAPTNYGHFGLASNCYTHFTSPIRRYPDLIVHRLVRKYLFNNNREGVGELKKKLVKAGEQTSDLERRATKIERRVNDVKSAEYMANYIGESYQGMVSGLTNSGMFIQLDNGVSGLVRFDTMADYYVLDEASISATGKRSGKTYLLGDRVETTISGTNVEAGNVDLIITGEPKRKERPKTSYRGNNGAHEKKSSGKKQYQNQPKNKQKRNKKR